MKKFITLDNNNKVIAIRFGTKKLEQEIEVEGETYVKLGDIFQDGKFITPETSMEELYKRDRSKYLTLIQEAEILGEEEEVKRLREEWKQIKSSYGY